MRTVYQNLKELGALARALGLSLEQACDDAGCSEQHHRDWVAEGYFGRAS